MNNFLSSIFCAMFECFIHICTAAVASLLEHFTSDHFYEPHAWWEVETELMELAEVKEWNTNGQCRLPTESWWEWVSLFRPPFALTNPQHLPPNLACHFSPWPLEKITLGSLQGPTKDHVKLLHLLRCKWRWFGGVECWALAAIRGSGR